MIDRGGPDQTGGAEKKSAGGPCVSEIDTKVILSAPSHFLVRPIDLNHFLVRQNGLEPLSPLHFWGNSNNFPSELAGVPFLL